MEGRLPRLVLFAVLGLIALWVIAYFSGAYPYLGYKSKHEQSGMGIGQSSGTALGPGTFYFFRGQTIFVNYEAEITSGSLWIYVKPYGFGEKRWQGALNRHIVTSSSGRLTYAVPKSGLYVISVKPSVTAGAGRGYDMRYSASWGAQWGGG